jgi:TonB family protein
MTLLLIVISITIVPGTAFTQRPSRYEVSGNDTIYSYTTDIPNFSGGDDALNLYKSEKLKYPTKLKRLGVEGTVFVRFLIEKDGSVSDVRIMQGVSPSLDAEAIRVTKAMPHWQAGKEKGKPVRFMYTTMYDFLLTPRIPAVVKEGEPYVVVEEMPLFPGGDSALLAFIGKNTKYPEDAKSNGIEGRVIIRFCITDTGTIDLVTVMKGVDPSIDAEAIRVVKSLPKFTPGKQGGKPVNVWFMVPITFTLGRSDTKSAAKEPPKAPPPPQGYDKPPLFKGGETALFKFINSKLVYPETAKKNLISGKVRVRFAINTDGSVGEVSVIKGVNPELDAEAVKVIQLLPPWKPAKLDGNPVKIWYQVPVSFTLK